MRMKLETGNLKLAALAITLAAGGALAAAQKPDVRTAGVTNDAGDHVTFVGEMVSTGSAPATAFCYWGLTDGVTNAAAWGNTNDLGVVENGPLTNAVMFLELGTNYWFRFAASNAFGFAWATNSLDNTTPNPVTPTGAGISHGPFYSWFADTNLNTDVSLYMPGHAGVYLFGQVAGAPATWISTGATYDDWTLQTGAQGQALTSMIAQTDTNATTDATLYTAAFAGQWLFGRLSGVDAAWVARKPTTNDWMLLRP